MDSSNQVLASQALAWPENGPYALEISLPNGGAIQQAGAKVSLKLSSCYTPRNLGDSIDGRRLGVLIDPFIIH